MSDDCDCNDVGALAYAEDGEDFEELDLVLDEPALGEMAAGGNEWEVSDLGTLELIGEERIAGSDDIDGEVGWISDAIAIGKGVYSFGKNLVSSANKPSKRKARQAQQSAQRAKAEADKLRAELKKKEQREKRNSERNIKIRQQNREKAKEATHQRQKKALEDEIQALRDQQALVRREADARIKAAEGKERQGRTRKLVIGGGMTAAGLLAAYALSRRPKPDAKEQSR